MRRACYKIRNERKTTDQPCPSIFTRSISPQQGCVCE
ncbi:hypothetical protein NC653_017619 [Populus alba x Populus x berolinensis]|uniref:Uncharacterized protein n=1 Tax=Populus alba x Populus x berolinensis TaxID=444605 RepID=A0AAD6QQR7_9ROSI|nr:hypothetical protein NC653_017619 [Populus alba x Populus x berolinensis]